MRVVKAHRSSELYAPRKPNEIHAYEPIPKTK
jgi:hypothetical protein